MRDSLSLVISAYNEEGNINELHRRLKAALAGLPLRKVEYLFVDDGSTDRTLSNCLALQAADPEVKIVRLWRNFGHETAMAAGLDHASGEAVVFLDADLQHPPELVRNMVELWQGGQDLVLTRRLDHAGASAWRRLGSRCFYRLINFLSETPLPAGEPDFRLLGAKYVKFLKSFNERDYLFRGFLAWGVPLDQAATLEFSAPPPPGRDLQIQLSEKYEPGSEQHSAVFRQAPLPLPLAGRADLSLRRGPGAPSGC